MEFSKAMERLHKLLGQTAFFNSGNKKKRKDEIMKQGLPQP